jgi:hypothetical protein
MSEIFNPADVYDTAVNDGCEKEHEKETQIYVDKRRKSMEDGSKMIISPSRSSFQLDMGGGVNTFVGKCQRQAYLESKEATITNKGNTAGLRRMKYGKIYEEQEHEYEQSGGILIDSNMRMEKKISDKISISGELDTLANLDGHKWIVEIKSYDGYYAKKQIQGNKSRAGMPKYDHIAQNMHYLAMIKEHPEHSDTEGVLFHYRTRADLVPTYHTLELDEVKDPEGKIIDAYPIINGTPYKFVSLRDLLTRGISLANHIMEDKLPPRDPEYQYSDEKIKYLLGIDEIAKSKYKEWQEGKSNIGDWQCSRLYCPYFKLCRGVTPDNEATAPSDEDIMKTMNAGVTEVSSNLDAW